MSTGARGRILACGAMVAVLASCQQSPSPNAQREGGFPEAEAARLRDGASGNDWPGYGRTYGEQHFSPLDQIRQDNVSGLGLAWAVDLPPGNPVTAPVAVGGIVYVAAGLAIVRAIDGATGRVLWTFDPQAGEAAGEDLRQGWGTRGLAYWNGKIYVGTPDGRLIALDAKNGTVVWSRKTIGDNDGRYITGAPRIFDGKVIIGHGGADSANVRGYVTTYDAETGRQLWRFFLVPGNPAQGFEDDAQAMAAKTWAGQWWNVGGGGTAWNAFTYDPETKTIFIGTGNGAPWNRKIRSADTGDNLFLCSIVALDAVTGKYKWHYQINPGETWDYNAAMDMHLADLTIDGKPRKVLMQAPKNGFTYVIDRISGKLISAEKIAKVTWASHIDLTTGRPVETPGARFPDGQPFEMWPGVLGAHGWLPSSFSPRTGLMYIPVMERGMLFSDKGITPGGWRRTPGKAYDFALNLDFNVTDPLNETSWLKAYDPVARRIVWSVKTPGLMSGGTMATAGALVFQGDVDSNFNAYAADTGRKLWTFRTQAPTFSAPISYAADGVQYVTVVTGVGTTAGHATAQLPDPPDYRGQHRRVLTFRIGGKAALPARTDMPQPFPADASFRPDAGLAQRGAILFGTHCAVCHGTGAISGGGAPDLRRSPVSYNAELFTAIVHGGGLVSNGMPRFGEIKEEDLRAMQHYLREEGRVAREGRRAAP